MDEANSDRRPGLPVIAQTQIFDEVAKQYAERTRDQMVDNWIQFFQRYQVVRVKNGKPAREQPYIEQIKQMASASPFIYKTDENKIQSEALKRLYQDLIGCTIFQLNYENLIYVSNDFLGLYDADDHEKIDTDIRLLCYQIRNKWDEANQDLKKAVFKLLQDYNYQYAMQLKTADSLTIHVINFEINKAISTLSSDDLRKFVRIQGIITQFDEQFSLEILKTAYKCNNCGVVYETLKREPPKKCGNCDEKSFVEDEEKIVTQDYMYFVLQDSSENVREGQIIPPTINVSVNGTELVRNVIKVIETGMKVAINGIVKFTELSKVNHNLATVFFEVVGIEILEETMQFNPTLREVVAREIQPSQIDDHYEMLKRSIAPHLQGLEPMKEGALLLMVGSPPLIDKTGSRVRGELNILELGNAATGKTELLKFVQGCVPGSVYVQGSNATKVGLTASLETTEVMRGGVAVNRQTLNAGVYGIVRHGGVVLLDELDKVASDEHYEAVSTAMDDFQKMYIHKSKVHAEIRTNCASYHAANPVTNQGMYNVAMDVFQQTNFHTWLWSRYDLKFLHLSRRDEASRHLLWKHKQKTHASIILEKDYLQQQQDNYRSDKGYLGRKGDHYDQEYLMHEVAYLRRNYNPILRPGSMSWLMMEAFWNRYNKLNMIPDNLASQSGSKTLQMPILDERSINSLIRLSQASARAHRRTEVIPTDMSIAIGLMKQSIGMFIPHIDLENEELRARIASTIVLEEGLKTAIRNTNKETAEKIRKFTMGLTKTIHALRNMLFINCDACHGTGHMDDRNLKDYLYEHIPCPKCGTTKGFYNHFTYDDFEQLCKRQNTFVNTNIYFKIIKKSKFIREENADEKLSTELPNPKSSMFITYYNVIVDLWSYSVETLNDVINELFGIGPGPEDKLPVVR